MPKGTSDVCFRLLSLKSLVYFIQSRRRCGFENSGSGYGRRRHHAKRIIEMLYIYLCKIKNKK